MDVCARCEAAGSYEECPVCQCCLHECTCFGDYDADELGLDPEERYDYE